MTKSPLLGNDGLPLYQQVETLIKSWVVEGTLVPGSKLPSIREMSRQLKVSISTIIQSYSVLEAHGVIEAKPQSGYYLKAFSHDNYKEIKSTPLPNPRFIQSKSRNLEFVRACSNPDLIPLGSALIDHSLLPTEALQRSLAKVAREKKNECMNYERLAGNFDLCLEISKRSMSMGCDISPYSIQITNGCLDAIHLSLVACTKPGDIVAVESPTFYGILRLLESLGLQVLELQTNSNTGVDLESFEEKMKKINIKAAIITPNFLNPIGSQMTDQDKEKLVQLCSKHNITIIEDDIYAELQFSGSRALSLKSFDKKDQIFFCSSFSKTVSPGYRIGWIVPPEKQLERIEMFKASTSLACNSAAQLAIADFLANHNYERHLRKLRLTLSQTMHLITMAIEKYFPAGTKVSRPKGGCLLWVEFPSKINTILLYEKMLKKKISIIPGTAFSSGDKYQNCIRINAGVLWGVEIENALKIIGNEAQKMQN
jgi:DNA-binding transcriptional MocR family regulator